VSTAPSDDDYETVGAAHVAVMEHLLDALTQDTALLFSILARGCRLNRIRRIDDFIERSGRL
jgi:hypothetical protein